MNKCVVCGSKLSQCLHRVLQSIVSLLLFVRTVVLFSRPWLASLVKVNAYFSVCCKSARKAVLRPPLSVLRDGVVIVVKALCFELLASCLASKQDNRASARFTDEVGWWWC